jgi:hypothetical protein
MAASACTAHTRVPCCVYRLRLARCVASWLDGRVVGNLIWCAAYHGEEAGRSSTRISPAAVSKGEISKVCIGSPLGNMEL